MPLVRLQSSGTVDGCMERACKIGKVVQDPIVPAHLSKELHEALGVGRRWGRKDFLDFSWVNCDALLVDDMPKQHVTGYYKHTLQGDKAELVIVTTLEAFIKMRKVLAFGTEDREVI